MRAATYARVSTQEQADTGTSLDTQRDRTRAYVDARGWELVAEYVDEGVSGAADRRPDLDRLMGECRDGNVDVIVVAKLDRFTRSSRHLANAMAELEDLGVGFASLAESVDSTTASGRMFRTLLGAFAEFERERITERMMEGHRRIIEAGGWTGGPPPFGYRAVSSGTMKKLALDDDGGEAETVRLAVSMVVDQGCSAYEAAKRLNALGKGPRRAARWSHQNLRRVLLNETIAGRWKWGKQSDRVETVTVPIPPIINVDRFDDLQRVLALTATGRRNGAATILSPAVSTQYVAPLSPECGERIGSAATTGAATTNLHTAAKLPGHVAVGVLWPTISRPWCGRRSSTCCPNLTGS